MKTKIKLTKGIDNFLRYAYSGNGKYYTLCQGSKQYALTEYAKFRNRYPQFVEILDKGNDAPRGGQTGNYEIVKFTDEFNEFAKDLKLSGKLHMYLFNPKN